MLTGETLLPEHKARLEASRVVHVTIDPTIAAEGAAQAEEEEEGIAIPAGPGTGPARRTSDPPTLLLDEGERALKVDAAEGARDGAERSLVVDGSRER